MKLLEQCEAVVGTFYWRVSTDASDIRLVECTTYGVPEKVVLRTVQSKLVIHYSLDDPAFRIIEVVKPAPELIEYDLRKAKLFAERRAAEPERHSDARRLDYI